MPVLGCKAVCRLSFVTLVAILPVWVSGHADLASPLVAVPGSAASDSRWVAHPDTLTSSAVPLPDYSNSPDLWPSSPCDDDNQYEDEYDDDCSYLYSQQLVEAASILESHWYLSSFPHVYTSTAHDGRFLDVQLSYSTADQLTEEQKEQIFAITKQNMQTMSAHTHTHITDPSNRPASAVAVTSQPASHQHSASRASGPRMLSAHAHTCRQCDCWPSVGEWRNPQVRRV